MPVTSYPLIVKGLSNYTPIGGVLTVGAGEKLTDYRNKQVASFERYIGIIEAAMSEGKIANPVWVDVKFMMGNFLERAWDGLEMHTYQWNNLPDDIKELSSSLNIYRPEMHTIPGKIVKLRTLKDRHPLFAAWLEIFEEVAPLGEAFKVLSKNTVKRQPKPVEDRVAKYNAPEVSGTATAKVRDLLIQITEESKLALEQQIADSITGKLTRYMQAQKEALAEGNSLNVYEFFCPRNIPFGDHEGASLVSGLVNGGINNVIAVRKTDYAVRIKKIAEENAASIRESFVYKNLDKIVSIVETKGNYKSGKVISREINLAGLRGTLRFSFTDGSHFTVKNAVVWVENSYGTTFRRFPLTFHDVVLPGVKKMARPSEKRMNEVFVKGGE